MNAGLLFYSAHRTSLCEKLLRSAAGAYDLTVNEVKICTREAALRGAMAALINRYPVVFVAGGCSSAQPDAARPIFEILRIPLTPQSEPKGVLRFGGPEKSGYLIESVNQAIVVLPDLPAELAVLLPQACARLKQKFDLTGEPLPPDTTDYKALIEESMEKKIRGTLS